MNPRFQEISFLRANNLINIAIANNQLIFNSNPLAQSDPLFWLAYYISDNFLANVRYVYSSNISQIGQMGFISMQRNIRNSIESYMDILLYLDDPEYINVIKKNSDNTTNFWPEKYNNFHKNYYKNNKNENNNKNNNIPRHFSLREKIDFYNQSEYINGHGFNIDMNRPWPIVERKGFIDLFDIITLTNSSVHPTVYNTIYDNNDIYYLLKKLLCLDVYIYYNANSYFYNKYINAFSSADPIYQFSNAYCNSSIDKSCNMPYGYANCLTTIEIPKNIL